MPLEIKEMYLHLGENLHHGEMSGCELCQSPGGGNTVNMSLSVTIKHGVSMMCIENRDMKNFMII